MDEWMDGQTKIGLGRTRPATKQRAVGALSQPNKRHGPTVPLTQPKRKQTILPSPTRPSSEFPPPPNKNNPHTVHLQARHDVPGGLRDGDGGDGQVRGHGARDREEVRVRTTPTQTKYVCKHTHVDVYYHQSHPIFPSPPASNTPNRIYLCTH